MYTLTIENVRPSRISSCSLARDKESGKVFKPKIIFEEYKGKEIQIAPQSTFRVDEPKTGLFELELEELKEAYSEGKLSGKLKELVSSLDEEKDNNVYMLLHFK